MVAVTQPTKPLTSADPDPLVTDDIAKFASQGQRAARRGAWRIAGDLPSSFRYAAQGLGYGFISQRNFRIHLCIGIIVFGLGL
ncbi:MAG: diacylglycerol kinase family protein, partial [Prochlorococcus sp.]